MVEIKWTLLSEVRPEQNYVAFAEMGERKSAWSYFSFMMRASSVRGQLKTAKGIVGYTARLEFSSRKLVMVAVLEDEMALEAFAHSGQHARCMEEKSPT
jgi:hypothetical protein